MSTVLSNWYVLHTYSGYENKVKNSLEKLIESNSLHDYIIRLKKCLKKFIQDMYL